MTQTLTTEVLQEIYEAAVHSEASGSQEAEFELLCKLEDVGGTSATIRKLIDLVRAANREAQPVPGGEYGDAYQGAREDLVIWKRRALEAEDKVRHLERVNDHLVKEAQGEHRIGEPVFTAPPAPAVVKLPTEFYSDEGIVVRMEEVMAALAVVGVQYERKENAKPRCEFPSSEVPEEMTGGIAMSKYKVKKSNYAQWVKGWNACRSAMLAQPVRRGCTVVPLGWIDCAFRVPDTDGNYWGWWSESKRQGPVWFIKSDVQAQFQSSEITHWMPLPAAPEGGST